MTPRPLLIRGGTLFDPGLGLSHPGDLLLKGGKIVGVGNVGPVSEEVEIRDATGCFVTPGWIDPHTHLRDFLEESKETIETGTRAAARGGFTSVACMANTQPVQDSAERIRTLRDRISRSALIEVFPVGAITQGLQGLELAEIYGMAAEGIVALSDDGKTVPNTRLMREALQIAKTLNLPVIAHCEDPFLKRDGVLHDGPAAFRLGLRGIPAISEAVAVSRDILLAEETGARLHIAHVSTAQAVELIRQAKGRGVQVSAEVTPHHLLLDEEAWVEFDPNLKMAPPLRTSRDRQALLAGLQDGTIDMVASDHAPHTRSDKSEALDCCAFGISGIEIAFSLYYELVRTEVLTLERLIEALTQKPAALLGLRSKGSLQLGFDADITVFSTDMKHTLQPNHFLSRGKNSPFTGKTVFADAIATLCAGQIVFSQGASHG